MVTSGFAKRLRVVGVALAVTLLSNYAISLAVAAEAENLPPNLPRPEGSTEAPQQNSKVDNLPPNLPRPV